MTTSKPKADPVRGEIWLVNFNSPATATTPPDGTPKDQLPTTGDEIYKSRPAVVMNIPRKWGLNLYIVVPITSWQEKYETHQVFWMVEIMPDLRNNLINKSAANTIQVQSASIERFEERIGVLTSQHLDKIAATIAFCIGYLQPKK